MLIDIQGFWLPGTDWLVNVANLQVASFFVERDFTFAGDRMCYQAAQRWVPSRASQRNPKIPKVILG